MSIVRSTSPVRSPILDRASAVRTTPKSADAAGRGVAATLARSSALVSVLALAGCGGWFGEEETILPGERVALRAAAVSQVEPKHGGVTHPPAMEKVVAWPQTGGDSTRTLGNIQGAIALERVWSTSIGAGSDSESRITSTPVGAQDRLYALDAAAQVTAISTDGQQIWRTDLTPEDEDGRDGFGGGLAIAGDTLVAATGFGELVGLSAADGSEKWRTSMGSPIRSAPAISQGVVVVVARDGTLAAFDAASGAERWRMLGLEGGASMLGGGGPAVAGQVVAAPFASGDIAIFRITDGRRGWSEPLGASVRGSAMSLIGDISSSPVLSQGRVYAGGVSGRIVALDVPSGRRVWGRDIGVYNPVWAAGDAIYLVSEDARVMALSAESGETVWETQLPRYDDPQDRKGPFAYGGPIMVGGKLYLTSSDGVIYRIDAASGAEEGSADLPGGSSIPPIAMGERLYVVDEDGDLHAYR